MKAISLAPLLLAAVTLACGSSSGNATTNTAAPATTIARQATVSAQASAPSAATPAPNAVAAATTIGTAAKNEAGATSAAGSAPAEVAASISQPPGDPQAWHFAPAPVTVRVGGTVTWTNPTGNEIHTVTADDGAFDSGVLSAGDTFKHTFSTPGTFAYHCTLHNWMKGVITVAA